MSTYTVSNLVWCKQTVQVSAIALLFVYGINFFFQLVTACVYNDNPKEKARMKQKLLQTSRVLYWSGIATMFSIYPPFYFGTHCAILAWINVGVVLLMHIACCFHMQGVKRTPWAYFYFFYHLSVGVWICVTLIIAYIWSSYQNPLTEEL